MAIILKESISALEKFIVPQVTLFIMENQQKMINDPKNVTPEVGAKMLANAICYAIAKTFESPTMLAAFALGNTASCIPPAPGPGPIIISAINAPPVEI